MLAKLIPPLPMQQTRTTLTQQTIISHPGWLAWKMVMPAPMVTATHHPHKMVTLLLTESMVTPVKMVTMVKSMVAIVMVITVFPMAIQCPMVT